MKRLKLVLAALAALVCAGLAAPDKAQAFDHRDHGPHGWDNARVVRHWVYYPRYVHVYNVDPYAYQYSPRAYYPYYGSRYWVSAAAIRARNHQHYHHWNVQAPRYKYHRSWGHPQHWQHGEAWRAHHHRGYHSWHY